MGTLLIFVLGLIFGSFLGALTFRLPKNISIAKGRSKCPKCGNVIVWYDNIPLLSYALLGGKCRNCHKHISRREPLIEFSTAIIFVCLYLSNINLNSLCFLLFLACISVCIVVIDVEHQIIPDELVWLLFLISLIFFLTGPNTDFYSKLLSGLGASLFLLFLNLATKGRGMGLGDVKLAIPLGFLLGFPSVVVWVLVSFVVGACVGLILIALKLASLKEKIPFGPFLIVGFWTTLFFRRELLSLILPFTI